MTCNTLLAAAIGAAVWLAGCNGTTTEAGTAQTRDEPSNPLEITVEDDLLRQLKIGEPEWANVAGSLRVAATVEAAENRLARVSAPVTGRITEFEAMEGQNVQRGQLIALIHSTELSNVQAQFLKADSQRKLAARAVDRAKLLLNAGVIGEAEVQRRDAELVQATADFAGLRDQLRLLGMSADAVAKLESTRTMNSISQVLATIDGTVMDRKATIGQVVQSTEIVCLLADLSSVWLVADVPEQAAGDLQVGRAVEAEMPALPGHLIHGRLSFVSATVKPETRTVRVRMDLPNPHRKYKPAMLATMLLKDGAERARVVPLTAVVREDNADHLLVQTADRTFLLREVSLGEEFQDKRVLKEGLRPGEKIVLDGAFHVNNERRRRLVRGDES